jgi:hypothetical protein
VIIRGRSFDIPSEVYEAVLTLHEMTGVGQKSRRAWLQRKDCCHIEGPPAFADVAPPFT